MPPINRAKAATAAVKGIKRRRSGPVPTAMWSEMLSRRDARNVPCLHRVHTVLVMPALFNLKPKRPGISTGVPQLEQGREKTGMGYLPSIQIYHPSLTPKERHPWHKQNPRRDCGPSSRRVPPPASPRPDQPASTSGHCCHGQIRSAAVPGQHPALSRTGGHYREVTPGLLSNPATHRGRCC